MADFLVQIAIVHSKKRAKRLLEIATGVSPLTVRSAFRGNVDLTRTIALTKEQLRDLLGTVALDAVGRSLKGLDTSPIIEVEPLGKIDNVPSVPFLEWRKRPSVDVRKLQKRLDKAFKNDPQTGREPFVHHTIMEDNSVDPSFFEAIKHVDMGPDPFSHDVVM